MQRGGFGHGDLIMLNGVSDNWGTAIDYPVFNYIKRSKNGWEMVSWKLYILVVDYAVYISADGSEEYISAG